LLLQRFEGILVLPAAVVIGNLREPCLESVLLLAGFLGCKIVE